MMRSDPFALVCARALCLCALGAAAALRVAPTRSPPAAIEAPLLSLLEEKRLGDAIGAVRADPSKVGALLSDAGMAGALAYAISSRLSAAAFWVVAAPVGELAYHRGTEAWVDPRLLLEHDGVEGKAETVALVASYYVFCKVFSPLRLCSTLLLFPDVKRFLEERPAFIAATKGLTEVWDSTAGRAGNVVRCAFSKSEGCWV